jgi:hypothetical protein
MTELYCFNCTNRVNIDAEPCNIRVCPECASEDIRLHVPEKPEYEDMIYAVVDQVIKDQDYYQATQTIDDLGLYLRAIAFHRKNSAMFDLMAHLEEKERGGSRG